LPETRWAAFTRLNKKRFYNWVCIWLVVLFEYLKMHGTTNHKMYYIFWVCICNPRYPACTAHAPYCHLWPAPLYNIFPYWGHKRQLFRK
jgi:hypothetical protein